MNLPAKKQPTMNALLRALPRARQVDLVRVALAEVGITDDRDVPDELIASMKLMAKALIEYRRSNIATLGDHEVFFRRSEHGDLLNVIRPVRLSVHDKTLWQLARWQPLKDDRGQKICDESGDWIWGEVLQDPTHADITFDGLMRIDEVVGSSKSVSVEELGDGRVQVEVHLVAASPDLGNPVMVQYRHIEDPRSTKLEMLGKLADKEQNSCKLIMRDEWEADRKKGWAFLEQADGVGYCYDLTSDQTKGLTKKYTEVLRYTERKAQTICMRNAMKKHPAFGGHVTFKVSSEGDVVIPVRGWAGDPAAVNSMRQIHQRIAHNIALPTNLEVIDGNASVEPWESEPLSAQDIDDDYAKKAAELEREEPKISSEMQRRNEQIDVIDRVMDELSADEANSLGYDPNNNTLDELIAIKNKASSLLDQAAAGRSS